MVFNATFNNIQVISLKHIIYMLIWINSNSIGGVMVSMLASSAVYRGMEPRSSQTKDYKIGICCFSESLLKT